MYFLFVSKTYSQITKESYGFKIQIFNVLFSEVSEPTDKFLALYDYIFASLFLNLNESTCQTRENACYFTSKALFFLEKIKF